MKHINFADLRVFLAIADTGNLTRAAAQCCITPSAASVRLKHLEEEAGCDLVKRLPRGLALTSAGERLAAEARKVFQQITRMTDAMTAFRGDERLVVRLAANYNAAVAFLPDDLSGFLLQNPDIRIDQRLFTSRGVAAESRKSSPSAKRTSASRPSAISTAACVFILTERIRSSSLRRTTIRS